MFRTSAVKATLVLLIIYTDPEKALLFVVAEDV